MDTTAAAAIRRAQESARTLRGRFAVVRAVGSEAELELVLGRALAACGDLVLAVPALEARHHAWQLSLSRTVADHPTAVLARAAVNHLARLTRAASRPVVVPDPGARFAGDWDEPDVALAPR